LESIVSNERAVVVYDQVGCGHSSQPPANELGLGVFVDELTNLRERLQLDRMHLLGTSWGGMLAIEYALSQPRGLVGLVLSSTLTNVSSWADEARRLRDEMPEPFRRVLAEQHSEPDVSLEEAELAFDKRHICRLEDAPEIQRMKRESNKDVYRTLWGPNEWTPTGTLSGWDVRDRLRELDMPTLVTAGRYDLCTPLILRELQEGLPHSRTVVFNASSHMPYLEEAGAYADELSRFLAGAEAGASGPPPL
jgi:proline-specific peptidase